MALGKATPAERALLIDALFAWSETRPALSPEDALALGLALLDASSPDPRVLERDVARARVEALRELTTLPRGILRTTPTQAGSIG